MKPYSLETTGLNTTPTNDSQPSGEAAPATIQRIALAILVVATFVAPRALLLGSSDRYVGIAPSAATIYNYSIAIVVLLAVTAKYLSQRRNCALVLLPFAGLVSGLLVFQWESTSWTISGALQIATGLAAYLVGLMIPFWYAKARYEFATMVCGAVLIQAFFVVLEELGLYRRTLSGPQDPDLVGRVIGLSDHPNQLARLMFLGTVFALLILGWGHLRRRLALITVCVAIVCTALTQSRTGLIAAGTLLLTYFALGIFVGRLRRVGFGLLAVVAIVVLPQLATIIDRFQLDPTGGARPYLNYVAQYSISIHPWIGVGVNEYVRSVGALDSLTASGVPVHNVFLLSAAEMGIPAAVALWAPFLLGAFVAVQRIRNSGSDGTSPQLYLAMLPGLTLFGLTDWGAMEGSIFVDLALTVGFVVSLMVSSSRQRQEGTWA